MISAEQNKILKLIEERVEKIIASAFPDNPKPTPYGPSWKDGSIVVSYLNVETNSVDSYTYGDVPIDEVQKSIQTIIESYWFSMLEIV